MPIFAFLSFAGMSPPFFSSRGQAESAAGYGKRDFARRCRGPAARALTRERAPVPCRHGGVAQRWDDRHKALPLRAI